jgi:hypothetical protein
MIITQTTLVTSNKIVVKISLFDNKAELTSGSLRYKRYLHRNFYINVAIYVQESFFLLMYTFLRSKYNLPAARYTRPRTAIEAAAC